MKQKIAIATLFIVYLAACSSQPKLRESIDQRGLDYSEVKLQKHQFSIAFKLRDEDVQQATDYALQRAAELTLNEEKTWFIVTNQNTDLERPVELPNTVPLGSLIKRNCGLIGCATTVTYPVGSLKLGFDEPQQLDSLIHIIIGNGNAPQANDVYIASDVIQHGITE